jgi:hypothetical protein
MAVQHKSASLLLQPLLLLLLLLHWHTPSLLLML